MTDETQPQDPQEARQEPTGNAEPQPGTEVVASPQRRAQLVANDAGYIKPTSIEEAVRLARYVLAGSLAPDSYNRDEGKVTLGIMAALEAGLPPLYGLRQIAIINGRPSIWGDAAMALIQKNNLLAKQEIREIGQFVDTDGLPVTEWPDDYGFVVRLWRRGQDLPYEGKYTVGDAKRAKLWLNTRKAPWMEHPKRMLMIRARAFPQRDGFADALAGLAIREEIEDTFGADQRAPVDASYLTETDVVEAPPLDETSEEETSNDVVREDQ